MIKVIAAKQLCGDYFYIGFIIFSMNLISSSVRLYLAYSCLSIFSVKAIF